MRVLIRTRGPDGSWKEAGHDVTRVTIGRGTHNLVELPGLLVALDHATLALGGNSGETVYKVEAKTATGVEVDGRGGVRQGLLKPGSELRIGPHRLSFDDPYDRYEMVLLVEPSEPGAENIGEAARLDLRAAGLRKRSLAYGLIALLLILGVVIPCVMSFIGTPEKVRAFVPHDTLWVGGAVSSGHAHFEHDCAQCHGSPFRPIDNGACLHCHENVGHHSDDARILQVKGFAGANCVDCHKEHRGPGSLISQHPGQCTSCHAKPGNLGPWSTMPAVTDFRDEHPAFRFTVGKVSADGTHFETERAPVPAKGEMVKDVSGLAFPHDVHLLKEGVKSPTGKEQLVCASCHTPDAAKAGFRDLDFEKHCQRCHALQLQTPERTLSLPHGQNDASRFLLEAFYVPAAQAAHIEAGGAENARRRLGADNTASKGPQSEAQIVAEVFEYQLCGKCHVVDTSGDHPKVIPPRLRHTWMPSAQFSHSPHDAVPCKQCHAVETSKSGDDLNLPPIETCRTCHAGTHSSEGVRTTCIGCHDLHRSNTLRMSGQTVAAASTAAAPVAPSGASAAPPVGDGKTAASAPANDASAAPAADPKATNAP